MTSLRFSLAQHDFPAGAVAGNAARMSRLLERAGNHGAALVAFPELALSGCPPQDLLLRPDFLDDCETGLESLGVEAKGPAALFGMPRRDDGVLRNAAAWLMPGHPAEFMYKQVLGDAAVSDDRRYFQGGNRSCVVDVNGIRLAFLVGEDIRHEGPAARAADAGAELIIVIAAAPWRGVVPSCREALLSDRARASGCAIAYVNLVGGQDDLLFDGTSMLINADGAIVARGPTFGDALLHCRFDADSRTLHAEDWPKTAVMTAEATLYKGLMRGIRDYVGKSGFENVLLGLSGGIDSALTLALAVDALGADRVAAVMLPSRYTSAVSLDGARAQAQALGVEYRVLPIEPSLERMLETLQPAFAGKPVDTTEENLQARIRGALLMALGNKHGKLLLATGNKSEMAVGYSTLYGDMCGAYAPLRDVYKTRVYRLSRWRNSVAGSEPGWLLPPESGAAPAAARTGVDPAPPIPLAVIERPPSAELRADQTDQDSLPPYDELDAILELFIEDEQAPADIMAAGHVADTVQRVTRLVLRNEFKRRQAPPGPGVTRRGFGRERRYPINSGWY